MGQNIPALLLALFLFKHFIADWPLQSDKISKLKGQNLFVMLEHVLHHAVLSFIILVFYIPILSALLFALSEIITHAVIDYVKINKTLLGRFQYPREAFWNALGFDQFLHQVNYVLFIFLLIKYHII